MCPFPLGSHSHIFVRIWLIALTTDCGLCSQNSNNLGRDADRCGKEGVTHKPQRDELSQVSLLWTYDNAVRAVPCHVLCQCSACCAMPYAVPVQRVLCYALCCDTAAACCA